MKTIFNMSPEEKEAHLKESKKEMKVLLSLVPIGLIAVFGVMSWINKPEHDAHELIKKSLKNPDGVYFQNEKIIDKKSTSIGTRYFWVGDVFAKNSFGAVVREPYCVVFEKLDGNKQSYFPDTYMKSCTNPPTDNEVALMKSLNKWD